LLVIAFVARKDWTTCRLKKFFCQEKKQIKIFFISIYYNIDKLYFSSISLNLDFTQLWLTFSGDWAFNRRPLESVSGALIICGLKTAAPFAFMKSGNAISETILTPIMQ